MKDHVLVVSLLFEGLTDLETINPSRAIAIVSQNPKYLFDGCINQGLASKSLERAAFNLFARTTAAKPDWLIPIGKVLQKLLSGWPLIGQRLGC